MHLRLGSAAGNLLRSLQCSSNPIAGFNGLLLLWMQNVKMRATLNLIFTVQTNECVN